MITVSHLSKYFNGHPAVKDFSVQYMPGQCTMVIGASGSGKTVLLKSTVGLLEPDEGDILFDGTVFNRQTAEEKKRIRREMGMLFQGSALFDFATAVENVMFPLDFFSEMSRKEKLERAEFCLRRVGLENIGDKYPSELSGGMQKRVGIARAYANSPKVLIMDEPFGALDAQTRYNMENEVLSFAEKEKRSILFVTNNIEEALLLGDRIILLTACPASIKAIYDIPFKKPRDTMDQDFLELRKVISENTDLAL